VLEEAFKILSRMSPFGEDIITYHFHIPMVSGKYLKSLTSNLSMWMFAITGDSEKPIATP
jgi:hypothetical protein